ncbi:MAG: hypothetical protein WAT74_05390, partial [Flavobacteriales bacterium]
FMIAYGLFWLAVPMLLWQWRKELNVLRIVIPAAAFYLALVFPLGLRMCEWRYLVLPFPFVLLLSTVFIMRLLPRLRRTTPGA